MNRLTTSKNPSKFGNVADLFWSCFSLRLNFPVGLKYNTVANTSEKQRHPAFPTHSA